MNSSQEALRTRARHTGAAWATGRSLSVPRIYGASGLRGSKCLYNGSCRSSCQSFRIGSLREIVCACRVSGSTHLGASLLFARPSGLSALYFAT